ncbi:prepilin-type N-terminal cleavage/methylation domain-containing protein [Chitinibacter sp. FCG-7]|uniref:Prepilin-type N-terminal cleavage/methylation domain-containing protein n=1 Tax=Chitinibacter mangrovi TaxID=3153927 RepID=A0AAU7FEX9_9NEIS
MTGNSPIKENMMLKRNSQLKKYHLGFSLIEMLVAVFIFSIGLLAVASLQAKLVSHGATNKESNIAESLAKQKMEELRRRGFDFLPANGSDTPSSFNSDFNSTFTRKWTISNGPTIDSRLVTVTMSWKDKNNLNRNFSILSYITKFDPVDFADLTLPPGTTSDPINTIVNWKPGGNYYKKDVIVKYKDSNGETKYYMSNNDHADAWNATDPGNDTTNWALVNFIQGTLQWTPNNATTHSVCELRFGDFNSLPVKLTDPEVTAFGTKNNGSIDPSEINGGITTRRCSPNMLSGIGVLSTKYACALKAGESKKLFVQCEIEDGSGGTTIMGPVGPYSSTQNDVNLSLCQNGGSCIMTTPAPTAVPTATPITTPTAVPTATPVVTATSVPTPTSSATPKPSATVQITINMANSNKKNGTSCTLQVLTAGTVCAASSWSTAAVSSGNGTDTRNYSTTCTLTGSSADINLQCGNTTKNTWSGWISKTITPGNTTTYTFNGF